MDKRFQVFISSTFEDLKDERQSVLKGILQLDHMPAGMELFPATDDTAWGLICDVIDASDYYVLVIGGRYGSLDSTGISFTEKEYDYAVSCAKPVIALLHENSDNLPRGKTETDSDAWEKLESFRKKVEKSHTCVYWGNANELKSQLIIGLTAAIKRHPSQGWVRSDSLASEDATRKIISLQEKVEDLEVQLNSAARTAPEGSERLAQGSDAIEVKFKASFSNKSLGYHDQDKNYAIEFIARVTWNELFGAIGPLAMQPVRETKIKSEIARFLKEKYSDDLYEECHDGYNLSATSIGETIFQTIKFQFGALGLIDTNMETKVHRDTEKEILFCELSPLGQRKLMEVRAIYKEQKPNKSSNKDALTRASS